MAPSSVRNSAILLLKFNATRSSDLQDFNLVQFKLIYLLHILTSEIKIILVIYSRRDIILYIVQKAWESSTAPFSKIYERHWCCYEASLMFTFQGKIPSAVIFLTSNFHKFQWHSKSGFGKAVALFVFEPITGGFVLWWKRLGSLSFYRVHFRFNLSFQAIFNIQCCDPDQVPLLKCHLVSEPHRS